MTLHHFTIAEIQRALHDGELSAREIARQTLDDIARVNPQINAWTEVTAQRMLAEADSIDALRREKRPLPPLAAGLLELTNGILRLTPDRRGFITAAGLLGWGGLSVHGQTAAVLSGSGVSLRRYLPAKALQGALSAVLAAAVWRWVLLNAGRSSPRAKKETAAPSLFFVIFPPAAAPDSTAPPSAWQ